MRGHPWLSLSLSCFSLLVLPFASPSSFLPFPSGLVAGVLAAGKDGGFWLVHSVPAFPDLQASSYGWGSASSEYGQAMLCVSMELETLDGIAYQLRIMHPSVYASNLPKVLSTGLPNLSAVLERDWLTGSKSFEIASAGVRLRGWLKARSQPRAHASPCVQGHDFVSFAKDKTWGKDLYEDLVAPHYSLGFLVETWRRGSGGHLPTYCTPTYSYDIRNVRNVTYGDVKVRAVRSTQRPCHKP